MCENEKHVIVKSWALSLAKQLCNSKGFIKFQPDDDPLESK
jgi:hypothetical protein